MMSETLSEALRGPLGLKTTSMQLEQNASRKRPLSLVSQMMAETPERKEGGRGRAGMEAFVSREISRELKFEAGRCAKSDRTRRE